MLMVCATLPPETPVHPDRPLLICINTGKSKLYFGSIHLNTPGANAFEDVITFFSAMTEPLQRKHVRASKPEACN
jgi:hypothetical protein